MRMKNKYFNKAFIFNSFIIVFAFIITIFLIITSIYIQEDYHISIGSVSTQKFIANKTIINEYATEKLKEKALEEISPLYSHDTQVQAKVINELNTFFMQLDACINDITANLETAEGKDIRTYFSSSKIYLTDSQINYLLFLPKEQLTNFKQSVIRITESALEQGIREDSVQKNLLFINEELQNLDISQELSNVGYSIISSVIEPNLKLDNDATEKARQDALNNVKPVTILKNQKIVGEGEIITEEIYSILDSLGYTENSSIFESIIPITGVTIFTAVLFSLMCMCIYAIERNICTNKKLIVLIFTLYIITILSARLMTNLPYMFVPITALAIITSILTSYKLSILLNFSTSIICFIIFKGENSFLLYFLITGMFAGIMSKYTTDRSKIIRVGILNSFINVIVVVSLTLFFDKLYTNILNYCLYAFLSGIFAIILAVGSLPIWENVFGITTSFKLLDLLNPNKKLIRRLMIEAPGTYHHSLIVANLAESAACDIGANPIIARVGAYYHDIGKLKYPQYFSENVMGKNLHDYMDPYNSIQIIKSHVKAGIEFADEYKLPKTIRDIIEQHHGSTLIKFFYYKALQKYPEDEVDENEFRYSQTTPKSKEAAIVMIADTVEAAVRSKIHSVSNVSELTNFVHSLIIDKFNDNQLNDSMLKIKDLETMAYSFMDVFKGMYHGRVAYPEMNKENKESENKK